MNEAAVSLSHAPFTHKVQGNRIYLPALSCVPGTLPGLGPGHAQGMPLLSRNSHSSAEKDTRSDDLKPEMLCMWFEEEHGRQAGGSTRDTSSGLGGEAGFGKCIPRLRGVGEGGVNRVTVALARRRTRKEAKEPGARHSRECGK